MFHPSQLERRFGGQAETPTNYWPPHMGPVFVEPGERQEKHTLISPDRYDQIVAQNPELMVHPEHIKLPEHQNRDFTVVDVPTTP